MMAESHAEAQSTPSEVVMVDGDAIEHHMMDAIVLAGGALTLMASIRYNVLRQYQVLERHCINTPDEAPVPASFYSDWIKRDRAALQRLCELIDAAMQFIGDVNNNCDAVDDYGMTDQAFKAMDRALLRDIEPERIKRFPAHSAPTIPEP